MSNFDMRDLANSLVNNNQYSLPPNDTLRMGVVAGYDPHFSLEGDTNTFPAVSVKLSGDERMMDGFRFSEHYVPHIGDTVICFVSPDDYWVLGALARPASPSNSTADGHAGGKRSPVSLIGEDSTDGNLNPSVTTSLLPNRIYKAEATINFTVAGGLGFVGQTTLKCSRPGEKGLNNPLVLSVNDIQGGNTYSVVGHATWSDTTRYYTKTNPDGSVQYIPENWNNKYPNSQYTWTLDVTHLVTDTPTFVSTSAYPAGTIVMDNNHALYRSLCNYRGLFALTTLGPNPPAYTNYYNPGDVVLFPAASGASATAYSCSKLYQSPTATPTALPTTNFDSTGITGNTILTNNAVYFSPVQGATGKPLVTPIHSNLRIYDMGVAT